MEYTGERMVPDKADFNTFWEHIYRYNFACRYVRGKEVLDIACGEGYGSAALQKAGAKKVIGVDISEEACDHAKKKYGLDARVGTAEAIPLGDSSVDVVVSFETIEHVPHPPAFVAECQRVLRPDGILVISTPNREPYHSVSAPNQFHCSELSHAEFSEMIEKKFVSVKYFSQRPFRPSKWDIRGLAMPVATYAITRISRIGWKLRPWFCPNLSEQATAHATQNPVDAILSGHRMFSALVDPYAIRKFVPSKADDTIYTLAVARRA